MKQYQVLEDNSQHFVEIARFNVLKEAIDYCRQIVTDFRSEAMEDVSGMHFVRISGGDCTETFRSLWIRQI